jgi:hypothetical protein
VQVLAHPSFECRIFHQAGATAEGWIASILGWLPNSGPAYRVKLQLRGTGYHTTSRCRTLIVAFSA